MTLWLPWLEAESSFRDAFSPIRTRMPDRFACVASLDLGESERALLEYYADIRANPLETTPAVPCDLLLIGRGSEKIEPAAGSGWKVLWEGVRPRDRAKEHYHALSAHRTACPRRTGHHPGDGAARIEIDIVPCRSMMALSKSRPLRMTASLIERTNTP